MSEPRATIRTLLVDDEQPARERLRRLLEAERRIEVVGEAEDGPEALEQIGVLEPDLVFLDIQMPGCDGLEVVASLPRPRPKIIFCTAFDEYAVDAFELQALDYLLKPINRARLATALERLERPAAEEERESALDGLQRAVPGRSSRFLARRGNRYFVIPRADVLGFVSADGLTRVQTAEHHYWMQPSLSELESRLAPESFFRVSRSAIVNLEAISEIVPLPGGQGEIRLTNGLEIEVSRRRFKDLLTRLGTG